jgi:7-cyano-7-deazaguanine synthase
MDRRKSLLIIDGGLVSAANFGICADVDQPVLAITFDTGHAEFAQQLKAAQSLSNRYGVEHEVVALPWLKDSIENLNRNGVFIHVAAAIAAKRGIAQVVFGFTSDQSEQRPDMSAQYMNVCNLSLHYTTRGKVKVVSYTEMMKKSDLDAWKEK